MMARELPSVKWRARSERGSAMIIAMIVVMVAAGLMAAMFMDSARAIKASDQSINFAKAYHAAEAGIERAVKIVWGDYYDDKTGQLRGRGQIADYGKYLDDILKIPDGANRQALPQLANFKLGGGSVVDQVLVTRNDNGDSLISVIITATGRVGDQVSANKVIARLSHIMRVEAGAMPFKGFDFAMFANNISCIMCHADIDTVQRKFNTDPNNFGTFPRVKIASLESLVIQRSTRDRTLDADTRIYGSMYTRGKVILATVSGSSVRMRAITDLSGTSVSSVKFNADGTIYQDGGGRVNFESMALAQKDSDTGLYLPNQKFYPDYPDDPSSQTDGEIPSGFPSPIADENGNKVVDSAEFISATDGAAGSLTAGTVYKVPTGSSYDLDRLPGANNGSLTGSYSGSVILVGTKDKPIRIDGDIAIDGDVIIKGVVEGKGRITARGNIYIINDLTYKNKIDPATGKEIFGTSESGESNLVAYVAGGNIIAGDYLTKRYGDLYDKDTYQTMPKDLVKKGSKEQMNFTATEITMFNRSEWTKTQSYLPTTRDKYRATALPKQTQYKWVKVGWREYYYPYKYSRWKYAYADGDLQKNRDGRKYYLREPNYYVTNETYQEAYTPRYYQLDAGQ